MAKTLAYRGLTPRHEANQLSLAKMTQESKILMADMKTMDPLARVWHEMIRERIGQDVMAARAASASVTAPVPSTFMPPPAPVEQEPAMEVPPVLAADDEVFVVPPATQFI